MLLFVFINYVNREVNLPLQIGCTCLWSECNNVV